MVKAFILLVLCLALLTSCATDPQIEIYATGLNQPRGMAFNARGHLYVAEAGAVDPADTSTVTPKINQSSRVVQIAPDRRIVPVVEGLPFTNYVVAGDIGATDVVILDEVLYVLTGEGYDDQRSRMVLRLTADSLLQPVASIRSFVESSGALDSLMEASAAHAANPFAMIAAPDGEEFYISDGASGRVLRMTKEGALSLWAEWPQMPPLTGLTFGPDGHLYVAMLSAFPFGPGQGAVLRTETSGALAVAVPDLTMPVDVAFDASGAMYVLEISSGPAPPRLYAPHSGRLLRIEEEGTHTLLLTEIPYPTAMAFSPQGDLYLAVNGAFSAPGEGAIWKMSCRMLGAKRC